MARGVVALRNEDVVIQPTLEGLVERNCGTHKLLLDFAQPFKPGLQLKMMVA